MDLQFRKIGFERCYAMRAIHAIHAMCVKRAMHAMHTMRAMHAMHAVRAMHAMDVRGVWRHGWRWLFDRAGTCEKRLNWTAAIRAW